MTFVGMGPLEILVVLLVAFIVLGPDRMLTAARTIGKVTGELRRLADGLPDISLDEEPTERPIVHRRGRPSQRAETARGEDQPAEDEGGAAPDSTGPVAFEASVRPAPDRPSDTDAGKSGDTA